ncbi:MAG TPA: multiheme c-type cytochrome [Pirellulales bacterium]|nr:multiheme c-type cytochrome [Pirellulales bacterium]
MSKQALLSLPVLALFLAAFLGCPSSPPQPPAAKQGQPAQATPDGAAENDVSQPVDDANARSPEDSAAAAPVAGETEPAAEMPAADEPAEKAAPAEDPPADSPPQPSENAKPAAAKEDDRNQAKFVDRGKSAKDSVGASGELFAGWDKPKLAIVITGEQLGYIEPCGCAGLENQKGGLRRRHTFLKQLAARGWPLAALDNGGLIHRFGQQSEIKFEKTVEGLKIMDYAAVGFGVDDLKLPAGAVAASVANIDAFVSANVGLFVAPGEEGGFTPQFRVIERGGMKLGVTAVLGDEYRKEINNGECQTLPAEEALKQVLPKLKKAGCDYLVLLAHALPDEAEKLGKQFPAFDLVVTAGGADEPAYEATKLDGGEAGGSEAGGSESGGSGSGGSETGGSETLLVEVGHKGMYAIVLGLYDDEKDPVRYQRVPLDDRFKDSREMDELMVNYQDQLKQLGWKGLGLRPANHPSGKFAGSKACAACHQSEFDVWQDTPHAKATETLTKVKPPRQFDPECISCHATGWNPQEFFPYASGYDSLQKTPLMAGNGCENCHGPGAAHVAAENGGDADLQTRLREALARSIDDDKEAVRRSCMECHDIDNSPQFKFDEYWPKVAH